MQFTNKAYLLIGGNVGNTFFHFQQALDLLNAGCGKVMNKSAQYQTAPWGNPDQPAFLNQVVELETAFPATELMPMLLKIEEEMGRVRVLKNGPRIIDIDILLFNDEIIDKPGLVIPHPELPNRLFALKPLDDIAAATEHPVLKKTIHQLLLECKDKLAVEKINEERN